MSRLFDTSDLEAAVFSQVESIENDPDIEFPALELELTLEDGQILLYEAVGIFLVGEKEYAGLHPKHDDEGMIHIMELRQDADDEIQLLPILDDDEFEEASAAFYSLIGDSDIEREI